MSRPLSLPFTKLEFKRKLAGFERFLNERGSAIYAPTNEYEVIRFAGLAGIAIIYSDRGGRITSWQGGAQEAYLAFLGNDPNWRAAPRTRKASKAYRMVESLAARDGWDCIFGCGTRLTPETATRDHIVPLAAGGPDIVQNMGLCCFECNNAMGAKPAAQKIAMAVARAISRQRAEPAPLEPVE